MRYESHTGEIALAPNRKRHRIQGPSRPNEEKKMATQKGATNGARTAKNVMDDAAASFETAAANGTHAVKENMERALAAASELNSFGKENFEAWVASSTAATKGLEAISSRAMAYSKAALEAHVAAAKSIMTAKSVQELVEKQTEYARAAFDGYVAEVAGISDLVSGFAKDAIKPINERVTAVGQLMQNGRVR
jgi:phasin family protein